MRTASHAAAAHARDDEVHTVVRPELPVDLGLTLGPLQRGPSDPTMRLDARGAFWRTTRTETGIATMRIEATRGGLAVHAWGPGGPSALASAPDLLGAKDSLDGFAPTGKLLGLHKRFAGMRIGRTGAVFEALLGAVCEQMVSSKEAWASYRALVHGWGERAPGPCDLWVAPSPEQLAAKPDWAYRAFGLERSRSSTLGFLARRAARAEETSAMPFDRARERLEAFPGIGPWTAACAAGTALGDADAVPLGDYHLPHTIAYAFTGAARGDEREMLELLRPYAGHRGRVVRLIAAAGIVAPRFGPRRRIRTWWQ